MNDHADTLRGLPAKWRLDAKHFADEDEAAVAESCAMELDTAIAALEAGRSSDWVLVPREPTKAMLQAAVNSMRSGPAGEIMTHHYRAMLAAAPQQQPPADVNDEARRLIAAIQSMRDRMMVALAPKFGEAFDGDFDTMKEAANFLKRYGQPPPVGVTDAVRELVEAVEREYCSANTESMEPDDAKVSYPEDRCHITFGMIRRAKAAIHQQPAPSVSAWKSPLGPCICNGANECPGCNPSEAIKLTREIATGEERAKHPPCMECGAASAKEAETMCRCSGDEDDCHGCQLWPDGDAAPVSEPAYTKADDLLHTIGSVEHPDAASGDGDAPRYGPADMQSAWRSGYETHAMGGRLGGKDAIAGGEGWDALRNELTAMATKTDVQVRLSRVDSIIEKARRLTTTGQGDVERLVEAAREVYRISERKHDAWDALRAALEPFGQQQEGQ